MNLPDATLASFKHFELFSIAYNSDGKYVQIMDKDHLSPICSLVCSESFTRNKNICYTCIVYYNVVYSKQQV